MHPAWLETRIGFVYLVLMTPIFTFLAHPVFAYRKFNLSNFKQMMYSTWTYCRGLVLWLVVEILCYYSVLLFSLGMGKILLKGKYQVPPALPPRMATTKSPSLLVARKELLSPLSHTVAHLKSNFLRKEPGNYGRSILFQVLVITFPPWMERNTPVVFFSGSFQKKIEILGLRDT